MKNDELGITAQGVCAVMDSDGFTFSEIESYLQRAIAEGRCHGGGYFILSEVPTK